MKNAISLLDLLGRVLVGFTFVYWGGLKAFDSLAAIFGFAPLRGGWEAYMQANHVPYLLMPLVILTELGGGLMLAAGFKTRAAAFALAGFCILANLAFHTAWDHPQMGQTMWTIFIKNLALAGALMAIAARGAGKFSLDHRGNERTHRGAY
ncbi:MAG: DoxX family protein [Sphingosinicella sp.]|nr:DoxX family protein [Sphingosinicella sp.]